MERMTEKPKTKENIKPLHAILRKAFNELNKIANEENIEFYPFAGTWLGAEWYGDILPWDDDIDLALTWDNFKKLEHALKNKTKHFKLVTFQDEGHENMIAKLYFNEGVLFEDKYTMRQLGNKQVFIDLTILFPVSRSTMKRRCLNLKVNYLRAALLSHRKSLSFMKRVFLKTITLFRSKTSVYKSVVKIWENPKKYTDYAELNAINAKTFTLKSDSKFKELDFIGWNFNVPFEEFENTLRNEISHEIKPLYDDVPNHIAAFDAEMSQQEYDSKLSIALNASKEKTATVFLMNDYYSLGGVTEYNKHLVKIMLDSGYEKINWIYTNTNNEAPMKYVIDPRINQIHLPIHNNGGIVSMVKNLILVKTKLSKILRKNSANVLVLNPYFSYSVLSKRVLSKNKKIISILHSGNEWIDRYFNSNIIRKILFKRKIKKIDEVKIYPLHKELEFFPEEKTEVIIPFHKNDLKIPKRKIEDKVIFCSRIDYGPHKKVGDFVELSKINSEFKHVIMGSGDKVSNDMISKDAEQIKNLEYFGKYDSSSLSEAFSNSLCQIMTSGVGEEGFGIVFIEAAKYGVPIFIRRGSSKSIDMIANHEGWFFYDDIKELPEKIKMIKKDYEFYSNSIKEFYEKNLSYEETVSKWKNSIK